MKSTALALVLAPTLAVLLSLASVSRGGEPLRIDISYPPRGMTTRHPRVRIAGSCDPSAKVTVRGKPVKVYPTGGFVDLVELLEGKNMIEISAARRGERRTEKLTVNCVDPLTESPRMPLVIDTAMMTPDVGIVLQPGDNLEFGFKGSPGAKAYWSLGGLVEETPVEEAKPAREGALKGVRGIYRGVYRVKRGDSVDGERVRFTLVSGKQKAKALSPGRVTLLPAVEISRGVVGGKGARLSGEPGGDTVWKLLPGTRVDIRGRSGKYLRLQIPGDGMYWVPEKSVERARGKGAWKAVSAGPPVVKRTRDGARVFIPLDGAPPVRLRQPPGERLLRIEIFAALCHGGGPEERPVSPVEKIEVVKEVEGACLVLLFLEGKQLRGYRCGFVAGGLACELRETAGRKLKGVRVVIDPGHGGVQPGAVSITGVPEKDLNLDISYALAAFLREKGARVSLTREGDSTLSLSDRIGIARRRGADIFVSIHNNSRPGHCDPLARGGADAYIGVEQSRGLAGCILDRLRGAGVQTNGCHERDFAVILPTDYPAVLVECGYLSHPLDEAGLLKRDYRQKLGRAIGEGVTDFVKGSH